MPITGRPPFKPTAAMRQKTELLVACGMSHASIARVIGIDRGTLEKYFPEELTHGASRKRSEVVAMLWASAAKGNVTAQKRLEEITRTTDAVAEHAGQVSAAVMASSKQREAVGKKEQANLTAQTAAIGTPWEAVLGRASKPN